MSLPSRMFNGVKYFRTSQPYFNKPDAEDAAGWFLATGCLTKVVRGTKLRGRYMYHVYAKCE